MKKKFAVTLMAMAVAVSASAIRAVHKLFPIKQSDGSTVMLYKNGDGRLAFYTTVDNQVVVRNSEGTLCYGELKNGELVASNVITHNIADRTEAERQFVASNTLRPTDQALAKLLVPERCTVTSGGPMRVTYSSTEDGLGEYGKSALGSLPSIGAPTIPVIMVEFSDKKFQDDMTVEKYNRYLNEEGYHEDSNLQRGSVKDYYNSQSRGLFNPTFDVCAKVTLSNGYAYYGGNKPWQDYRVKSMLREAITSAIAQGVDFNKYVVNNRIPNVILYYAGVGEATSNDEDAIWPHEQDLTITTGTIGGFLFSSYFVGNERYGSEPNTIVQGMGVMVHELGHALGLPDFYVTDYSYTDESPLGMWSVMDSGPYANDSYAPVGMNAYERSYLGWLKIKELTDAESIALYPASEEDKDMAVLLRNPNDKNEYFIMENYKPDTWYYQGPGLLLTHFTYDKSQWNSNTLNNKQTAKRAMVISAASRKIYGDANNSDLFGNGVNNILSFPLYDNTSLTTTPVYKIMRQADGVITFDFKERTQGLSHVVSNDVAYEKVTSLDELSAANEIIFVNEQEQVALSTSNSNGKRMPVGIKTEDGDKVYGNSSVMSFTPLKAANNAGWGFRVLDGTEVLGVSSSGLKLSKKADATCIATVSFSENGNAVVTFGGTAARKNIGYDAENIYFTSFADAQDNLQIYRKVSATGINAVSVGMTATDGKMYNLSGQQVGEGYKGIVIVNGKKMLKK